MGIQNPIRQGLAVAVILLFIGVALAPSIKSDVTISTISLNEGNLSGYVNDTLMNPVQGARVRVYFHETYEEDYTDSSGYYHVTNIPICYCLKNATASKAGYTTEWVLLSIDENTTYDFVLTPLDGNTLYVGGDGPGNYSRIQDAVDDASDGDTVFVYDDSSPYYENVLVDKSIDLIGENRDTTVIDGGGEDDVVYVSAEGVTITGFTVENGGFFAIFVFDSNGILIDILHDSGLEIRSNSNSVFGNIISMIFVKESSDNSIFHNKISSIVLFNSSNNVIFDNTVSNNGIFLYYSSENIIFENNINHRLSLNYSSNYNKIYHNNFVLNVYYDKCDNTWDNGYPSCGNYWDDYIGEDNDGDGVGDIPHNISGGNNQDRYPLMEPYGMTELTISMGSRLFKFSGVIKNIGNKTAFNVQWKITVDGGIILIGRESSGYLPRPLLAGEETSVSSGIVIGFGRIVITVSVWADNAPLVSKSIPGFLFLFFIKIREGYRLTPMIYTGVFV